jgi:hypothetical protein
LKHCFEAGGSGPQHHTEKKMKNAVEASVSRSKAIGATSNLYIVEGESVAFYSGDKSSGHEAFAVSTKRGSARPTRVGYLSRSDVLIETLWPRPIVGDGWTKNEATGFWSKNI